MSELLPILTGLIVVSALAVVASNDKKDDKKDDKEKREYKPREEKKNKDDDLNKLFGYFKKNLSVKKKPKRYHKVYSKGRTKRDTRGRTLYEFRSISK
jgi:hypothetical protein